MRHKACLTVTATRTHLLLARERLESLLGARPPSGCGPVAVWTAPRLRDAGQNCHLALRSRLSDRRRPRITPLENTPVNWRTHIARADKVKRALWHSIGARSVHRKGEPRLPGSIGRYRWAEI